MKRILLAAAAALLTFGLGAEDYTVTSPDGQLVAKIQADGNSVSYSVDYLGSPLITTSSIGMKLTDGTVFGSGNVVKSETRTVDETIDATFYRKAKVADSYNELYLKFKGCALFCRAYDDGFAWRWAADKRKTYMVEDETATFAFPQDWDMTAAYVRDKKGDKSLEEQFQNSFENTYTDSRLSEWDSRRLAMTPLMVKRPDGVKVCILESDRLSYPGMFLHGEKGSTTLAGKFAGYPSALAQGGHNNLQMQVKERAPYIAQFEGPAHNFPWRAVCVSTLDIQMADNDMVYRLASAPEPGMDFSWVKPGKVAWDWWNDWNIKNVDFKAGVNTQTYKYYIDFASAHGIEYVILDEGWAVNLQADLFQVVPEIDLPEICSYAQSKGVGIILWAGYWAFARDIEKVCEHYSKMGVKGYKVDFMDRDDQIIENFLETAARTCAKYHQMLDFHGIHEPTGLQRKWPNIINYEGIHGLEQLKWGNEDQVTFDVQIPFIRYVAGFADYTQGAMRNATKANYRPVNSEPMSQGTRCHQLGEYIVFDAPLTMLCDSPSAYMAEEECAGFIASVPTVWDETMVLDGKVGEYIVTARKKDGKWWIGAINGWQERDLQIDLSRIVNGAAELDLFIDGVNADRIASDYSHKKLSTDPRGVLRVHLAPGGGFAGSIR